MFCPIVLKSNMLVRYGSPQKLRNCDKAFPVKSKMADSAQIGKWDFWGIFLVFGSKIYFGALNRVHVIQLLCTKPLIGQK